jgi:Rrf2 family transcriptional regulator, iron-sulfur cluster assembly transcription factor
MKLSTRSRYGARLILDMAEHYREGPIQLRVIAKRQGIPVKYLEQIIIPLKKASYVTSVRGYKGGHLLAKEPEQITLGEIVKLLEGGLKLTRCTDNPETCERAETCVMRLLWEEATGAMYEKLNGVTFADLVLMVRAQKKNGSAQRIPDRDLNDENNLHCHK